MTSTRGPSTSVSKRTSDKRTAERVFSIALLVSAVRCTFAYVLLPFVAPFIGLAPGVGPLLGLTIGVVAIVANVASIRRFWRANHPWRIPMTVLNVTVIAFLLVLMYRDLATLFA